MAWRLARNPKSRFANHRQTFQTVSFDGPRVATLGPFRNLHMSRFHINPKTGNPGRCSARIGNCPFGADVKHYASAADARTAFENSMAHNTPLVLDADKPNTWPANEENNEDLNIVIDARFDKKFGKQGLSIQTRTAYWDGRSLDWEANVFSADGEQIGIIRRRIVPGNYANNELMSLGYEARGFGFASEFNKEYEGWLKELGVKEVRVYAASQPSPNEEHSLTGALHWAKTFNWDKKPIILISQMWNYIEDGLTSEEEKSLKAVIERFDSRNEADWPTPREIAALGPNDLGKRILCEKLAWSGKRSLEN